MKEFLLKKFNPDDGLEKYEELATGIYVLHNDVYPVRVRVYSYEDEFPKLYDEHIDIVSVRQNPIRTAKFNDYDWGIATDVAGKEYWVSYKEYSILHYFLYDGPFENMSRIRDYAKNEGNNEYKVRQPFIFNNTKDIRLTLIYDENYDAPCIFVYQDYINEGCKFKTYNDEIYENDERKLGHNSLGLYRHNEFQIKDLSGEHYKASTGKGTIPMLRANKKYLCDIDYQLYRLMCDMFYEFWVNELAPGSYIDINVSSFKRANDINDIADKHFYYRNTNEQPKPINSKEIDSIENAWFEFLKEYTKKLGGDSND